MAHCMLPVFILTLCIITKLGLLAYFTIKRYGLEDNYMERLKNHVRCITIVHPLQEIRKYREFSAFFRMLGIFVCENITGDEYGDATDYTIVIPSGSEQQSSNVNLSQALWEMRDVFDEEAIQMLRSVYTVFADCDLMRASYAIAYFFDAKMDYIYKRMLDSYDQFDIAWGKLLNIEHKVTDKAVLKYVWAAKSNCRRRMNELYTIIWDAIEKKWYGREKDEQKAQEARRQMQEELWSRKYFSYDEINEDIQKILNYEPDFYGAYAIRGFASELDDDHRFDSVSDLLTAVNNIGSRSYTSYLCYRIGKYYETIGGNSEVKWVYYRMSWERDPHNYRALYKLILKEQADGNLEQAGKMWAQLIGILEKKAALPALQPIECAYLFKGYTNWGKLHIKKNEVIEAISCFQKAENIYENQANEDADSGFYPWMFRKIKDIKENGDSEGLSEDNGKIWEIYKASAKKKLVIEDVYNRLANIAADTGRKELYDKYYPLSLRN